MQSVHNISVIIPVYNGNGSFKRCLESVCRSNRLADEVIVISDGSTDSSCEIAESFGTTILSLPVSKGPARARNIGAKSATGDILVFFDADVMIHKDTLGKIEKAFLQAPSLDALIGSYDDNPGADNFLSQYKNLFHHYTHQTSPSKASTFWGACGAIRRSAFWAIGGFDESYSKPCIEDIELGYRLNRAAYCVQLCKDIQVKHLKRWDLLSLLRAEIFYRALPWSELLLTENYLDSNLNLNNANRISVIFMFVMMCSLIGSLVSYKFLFIFALMAISLIIINFEIYTFFYQKRGLIFTLKVIPYHWLYFLYGGACFGYAFLKSRLRKALLFCKNKFKMI